MVKDYNNTILDCANNNNSTLLIRYDCNFYNLKEICITSSYSILESLYSCFDYSVLNKSINKL